MFRICLAQAPADLDGTVARIEWLRDTLQNIGEQRTDLIILPELFACGYYIGADIKTRAEPAGGPTFQAMSDLAAQWGMAIHYGFAETEDDQIYNTAICIGPDGRLINKHRKLAIPPGFERDYFKPGQEYSVFEYRGLKISTLICYDAEFPETARHVAAMGAQLVLVPTALGAQWEWVAETMIPTRAYENGVFLAYANSAGNERGLEFLGHSVIAAPDGVELARAGKDPELLFADVDVARVQAAQARLPYLKDRKNLPV